MPRVQFEGGGSAHAARQADRPVLDGEIIPPIVQKDILRNGIYFGVGVVSVGRGRSS